MLIHSSSLELKVLIWQGYYYHPTKNKFILEHVLSNYFDADQPYVYKYLDGYVSSVSIFILKLLYMWIDISL